MPTPTWSKVLEELKKTVSQPNFATWLKNTELLEDGGGIVVIGAPNHYAKNWLEKHSLDQIKTELEKHYPQVLEVKVVIRPKTATESINELPLLKTVEPEEVKPIDPQPNPFNPHYTFESLVVGNHNRLAFAAAQVVAEKPGSAYNPLFIYGGVGLGKTHLMQAIGNEILHHSPQKKIIYTSCEIFTSEFVQSLQNKTVNDFKKKYRSVDVFLIDDIQFLANKEGTQEEFFHTFNILHQANRQIVITSDRVPREIPQLEDRLTSRLGWGMIADIQVPNFETRLAILQSKAAESQLLITQDALEFIATTISSNVRELEGSLKKLAIAASMDNVKIDRDFAAHTLKDLLQPTGNVTSQKIIQVVARYLQFEVADLVGSRRQKELVHARHLVMYFLRTLTPLSLPQIGDLLGGRDHTTVMHAVDKITAERRQNPQTEADIKAIEGALYL